MYTPAYTTCTPYTPRLRRGLPHDFTHYMGILGRRERDKQRKKGGESPAAKEGGGLEDGRRAEVEKKVAGLLAKVVACAPQV